MKTQQEERISNQPKRMYSLDLLKIIATIIIVFHHYQQTTGAFYQRGINFYNGKFYWGYIVELFFVISGYVVAGYSEKIAKGLSFKEFYLRRYLRIAPVMAAGAVVYELFLIVYTRTTGNSWFDISPSLWGTIISILGIQEGWSFANPFVNNPTWYISVLLLCYMMFYFSNYLSQRLSVSKYYFYIAFIFLGIGIKTYGINLPFLNKQAARGYYAMFWGVLLASILRKPAVQKQLGKIVIYGGLLSGVIVYLLATDNPLAKKDVVYLLTFVIYTILICFSQLPFILHITDHPIIGILAKISFDVFIWHNPFFFTLYLIPAFFKVSINYNSISTMLIYTVMCFIIGTVSYCCLEKPAHRWIDSHLNI